MIEQKDAELLAQEKMQEFVNACGCNTNADVANALMKLASVCGVGMCAVVGRAEAVLRMQGTADFIAATQGEKMWNCERSN